MKNQIFEEARIFALNYFCDRRVNLQHYLSLTEDKLTEFKSFDEKLTFLMEIIRLGRDQMDSSVSCLKKMESFKLSNTELPGHEPAGFASL
ncbi:MAG: hypothetical protein WC756_18635 [Taibaiella sp.]|jgi:hypothetical protein